MMRTSGSRLAAAVAGLLVGGAAALAAAAPGYAHDQPAPGFNAVLHDAHHGMMATGGGVPGCRTVVDRLGTGVLDTGSGYDTWVFSVPGGRFDLSGTVAALTFDDTSGEPQTVAVPHDSTYWIAPGDASHLAVAVPAGWMLLDADFAVAGGDDPVEVVATCASGATGGEGDGGEGDGGEDGEDGEDTAADGPTAGEDGDTGDEGEAGEPDSAPAAADDTADNQPREQRRGGLAVTGAQVGGMLILGVGMLAAGFAMTAVKRRRDLSRLLGDS